MQGIPVIPPGNVVRWCGLYLERDEKTDCYRARAKEFEWEVDVTLNDDDEYEARASHKGVKLAQGSGKTRPAALTAALQNLSRLESLIGNEAFTRREGGRAFKNRKG